MNMGMGGMGNIADLHEHGNHMGIGIWLHRDAQENAMFELPEKDVWPINFAWKMSRMLVQSTRWEQTRILARSQILMPM